MSQIVECVPNFSEGRNQSVIDAIAESIRSTPGCTLLDVDPGKSTNRTVYTFVGSPSAVVEGALNSARVAHSLIDMRKHKGAHPRNGAMDVCPFVPVAGVTMQDCVQLANTFAHRLADEQSLPTYLYAEAAVKGPFRVSLSQLRGEGEYEGLAAKLSRPEWAPDYGPKVFVPEWGITQTGARPFLIAYNVNVLGTKEQAHRIALDIREQGRGPNEPGKFKKVKAIGWFVEDFKTTQVSINLEDYRVTGLHHVFDECRRLAESRQLAVCGSEVVGLLPLEALLMAADHYIRKENLMILDERTKLNLAINRLGLSAVKFFNPDQRIIYYMLPRTVPGELTAKSVRGFVEAVAARSPAPGGGSVAALATSCGWALSQMMAWMSYGTVQWQKLEGKMRDIIPPIDAQVKAAIPLIDLDTQAFNGVMAALSLPKDTNENKAARDSAMQSALKEATEVPLTTLRIGAEPKCWAHLLDLARVGNMNSRSDLEVGAKMLEAGVWGAARNVRINLANIKDKAYVQKVSEEADRLVSFVRVQLDELLAIFEKREKEL